jgi:ring-1,2-phenylacetyl-CoA epoxidase subunit PaaD
VVRGAARRIDEAAVYDALSGVMDPEIPNVSIVDLGIVQRVTIDDGRVTVAITPTFTGCPALEHMRAEVRDRLLDLGADEVEVPVLLDPPWSTDRISAEGRAAMKRIGIAPPDRRSAAAGAESTSPGGARAFKADTSLPVLVSTDGSVERDIECQYCGSTDTVMESPFGPTICRSIHYCHGCRQSFERFKALGPAMGTTAG